MSFIILRVKPQCRLSRKMANETNICRVRHYMCQYHCTALLYPERLSYLSASVRVAALQRNEKL